MIRPWGAPVLPHGLPFGATVVNCMSTTVWRENPYIIGRPIYGRDRFYGREELFDFIRDVLSEHAKVILLHGQRRIGKSSVLRQIPIRVPLESEFFFVPFVSRSAPSGDRPPRQAERHAANHRASGGDPAIRRRCNRRDTGAFRGAPVFHMTPVPRPLRARADRKAVQGYSR